MTRFDVVGHSQGGVLARMLSSKNGNSKISDPFRGTESYDRGRFHRVVTIGAPHNGTRLLHYLAKLIARARVESPSIAAALRPLQPILQSKFDPFGQQFRDINNPDLGAPWYPDPAAPFHLIRTSIDLGASPTTGDTIPAYKMMGLAQAGGGAAVIPRGSDGVVDYDSEGANVPPASLGANVDDVPGAVLAISHTFLHGLFSANEAQVDSTTVARHVRNALDQNGLDPTENIQFAGFQLPPTLADSQRQMIDDWAAKAVFARNAAKIVAQMPSPRPLPIHIHSSSFSSYVNKVEYLNGQLPQGDVNWLATVYGSQGITTNGLNLAVQGPNNSEVVVTLDDSLVGDVVLQAFYIDASNEVVATPPQLVVSHSPLGVTLTGLELLPSNPTLPVGTEINAQLMARYSDGTSSLRYVTADQVTAKSSDTNIVSVDNPLGWELLAPGTAQVVVAWSGLEVTNQVSVFVSVPALPALSIRSGNDGTLRVSWPSWASDFVLESAGDLSPANGWQPVSGAPSTNGLVLTLAVPGPHATDYFRLRR
jgi:pimeloyl-ACP methyl ester carboxylesterase